MITIGGKAGSGKGTVAALVAQALGYEHISIGSLKRQLALQMGISIEDFNALGDMPGNAYEFDKKYEDMQRKLDPDASIVLDSRLGFYCQPQAFKVFLDVDIKESARRIMSAHRPSEKKYTSIQEAIAAVQQRNFADRNRYLQLYGVDCFDTGNYDLVIDTTDKTPQEVANIIVQQYKNYKIHLI